MFEDLDLPRHQINNVDKVFVQFNEILDDIQHRTEKLNYWLLCRTWCLIFKLTLKSDCSMLFTHVEKILLVQYVKDVKALAKTPGTILTINTQTKTKAVIKVETWQLPSLHTPFTPGTLEQRHYTAVLGIGNIFSSAKDKPCPSKDDNFCNTSGY